MITDSARIVRAFLTAGVVRPFRPSKLLRLSHTLLAWGTSTAAGSLSLATRFPGEVGLIDDRGSLTFDEVHRRSNALARGLAERGVSEGDTVAVLCRNHRYFVETTYAVAKLGADVVYLNTGFSGPQLAGVLDGEGPVLVVLDQEFLGLLDEVAPDRPRLVAWVDAPHGLEDDSCDLVIETCDDDELAHPERQGRSTILTSGTTGTPKGASRGVGRLDAAASLLARMPLRARWTTHIAAPLFHTWGWGHFQLGLLLGSTVVLTRRFDPRTCLDLVDEHRCHSLAVIPVMLQRILEAVGPDGEAPTPYRLERLRVVAASGSALPGDLAGRWMDAFGETLYNTYGSTEVAWATVATPADLREAPGTAGRPPPGTTVAIYDDVGAPVEPGRSGRIFVANAMLFDGYTGGGSKDVVDGLMATGDVGHFDESGRLFVEGRDDDMIVSGGENVFPQEVEDTLVQHEEVVEAAAVGVADAGFGQRLRAYVVVRPGATVTADGLREHVKANLARYKVPRDVVFVESLPRNETGKVLKDRLPTDPDPSAAGG